MYEKGRMYTGLNTAILLGFYTIYIGSEGEQFIYNCAQSTFSYSIHCSIHFQCFFSKDVFSLIARKSVVNNGC